MAYEYQLAGHILFESADVCQQAIADVSLQMEADDVPIFREFIQSNQMSPNFIFFDEEGSMPASTWQSLDHAFSLLANKCISIFVSGSMDFSSGYESIWVESLDDENRGFQSIQSSFPPESNQVVWIPPLANRCYRFKSPGKNITEELLFREMYLDGIQVLQMDKETNWFFDDPFFIYELNSVYIVCRTFPRFHNYPNGTFGDASHSKQILFPAGMKPGFTNIVYSYSESDFYAMYAESYEELQVMGEIKKCLKLRIDRCGLDMKQTPKTFPWDYAPWGKYIKWTSFIWLAEGIGPVKFEDNHFGENFVLSAYHHK